MTLTSGEDRSEYDMAKNMDSLLIYVAFYMKTLGQNLMSNIWFDLPMDFGVLETHQGPAQKGVLRMQR